MLFRSLGAKSTGISIIAVPTNTIGGILISTDSTNAAVVLIKKAPGGVVGSEVVFDFSTKVPQFICMPLLVDNHVQLTVSGTGAYVQLFEWVR